MYSFHPTCEIRQILRLQVLVCHGSQEKHFLIVAGGQNSSSQMRKCHSADEQLARSVIFLVSALPLQKTTSLADVHIMQVHLRRALFVHILLFHFHLLTRRPSTCCDLPTCCQAKCMRLSGRQEGAAGGAPQGRRGMKGADAQQSARASAGRKVDQDFSRWAPLLVFGGIWSRCSASSASARKRTEDSAAVHLRHP
jgi:hypothetical protein